MSKIIATRYAPSPTGEMHIGNLRTALYSYLIAKAKKGKFILRIEDTDRERFVEGANEIIFNTLKQAHLQYDEGPDIGGPNGPYVQSERKDIYQKYAEQLIAEGKAYYCFCTKAELEAKHNKFSGYPGTCRNLTQEQVSTKLAKQLPFVIRFKTEHTGTTSYTDNVFGEIVVDNSTLQDIVLIKADGYPTYNFAHIIDDHLMGITEVVRGNEYITSTPQYVQIYKAFGWNLPNYYHLPLIMGKNADGEVSKLSKRHGSVSFKDLTEQGYLPEAILNYIALLGWHPANSEQEFFTLKELEQVFNPEDIRKSSAIFDYEKLKWMNQNYISKLSKEEFAKYANKYLPFADKIADVDCLLNLLQPRIDIFSQIPDKVNFFDVLPDYDISLFINDKKKSNLDNSKLVINESLQQLQAVDNWTNDNLFTVLNELSTKLGLKSMTTMWIVRIAISGNLVTVGGATEIMQILGKQTSLNRLQTAINKLN